MSGQRNPVPRNAGAGRGIRAGTVQNSSPSPAKHQQQRLRYHGGSTRFLNHPNPPRFPMTDIVIAGALRTAIGKFGGTLAKTPAPDLGATVIRALLEKSGVKPDAVSEVIMGQVLTAGSGQNPARQASIRAGLPHTTT